MQQWKQWKQLQKLTPSSKTFSQVFAKVFSCRLSFQCSPGDCQQPSQELLTADQRKRRNSIAKYAGFVPPLQKGGDDQKVLDELFKTQKVMPPPVGTTPKEKLHDNVYQKIIGPEAKNDASFKTGTTLIQEGYAYFKFDKF